MNIQCSNNALETIITDNANMVQPWEKKMRMCRCFGLILVVSQLSACVSLQQTVAMDATPIPNSGYVAGSFTTTKGNGFGFGIVNTESGLDYVMPFGQDTLMPSDRKDQLGMIQLPPGKYKISYWVTYATLTKERTLKKDINNPLIGSPFTVAPGSVVFVGGYSASTEYTFNQILWSIRPNQITLQEAQNAFAKTYPKFSELPFSCTLCVK